MTEVILVDEDDVQTGTMEKMEAHQKGLLHRAFSIFIFNSKGHFLLQQRADAKYHNGGMWTNTCCSHPLPGEPVLSAANRRLLEEMGFVTALSPAFNFIYKASFANGLTEHEFDHVFTGVYDGIVKADKTEVNDFCFKKMDDIEASLQAHPQNYTEWFKIALPQIKSLHEIRFK
ncbi:MAG: isopentenyl-diphosphate Delta-isomerase [Ginsengibacter sp.]